MKKVFLLTLAVGLVLHNTKRTGAEAPQGLDPLELQADPNLQAKLSKDLAAPKVQDVLKSLGEVTGLRLTVEGAADDEPAFGSLSLRNVAAWSVMQELAQSKAVQGRWVKADGGYRLVGTRSGQEAAPGKGGGATRWLLVGSASLLLLISGWLLLRQARGNLAKSSAAA